MKTIGIILLLILVPVFFYAELIAFPHILSQKDWLARSYPLRVEGIEQLTKGIIPLWNPYMLCGNPLLADIDIAIGYPLYIFDFFMPPTETVRWNFLLHLSLAGIFMYLFLKILNVTYFGAIIGAITFMLGGYTQSFMPHPMLWVTTIYIPLIFLLFELALKRERRIYIILAGITLALQLLSGVPQIVYYTLLALFLYAVYHSLVIDPSAKFTPLLYFLGLSSLGFLLSAFQLLPTYEYYLQSAKYHFQAAGDASHLGAMLPHALIFFIGVADPYVSGFIGIGGLFLALCGFILRKNKTGLFFGLISLLVLASVFKITQFYRVLFHIPGFNMFNSLHRFVCVYAFAISVLAGFGAGALIQITELNARARKRISLWLLVIIFILTLTFALNYFLKDYILEAGQRFIEKNVLARPGHPFTLDYYIQKLNGLQAASLKVIGLAILPLLGIFILMILRGQKRIKRFTFQTVLLGIIILELYGHWLRLDWKLVDPIKYYQESEAVSFIKKDHSLYRVFGLDSDRKYHFDCENIQKMNDLLVPDIATLYHIQDPQGMGHFPLWNYWQLLEVINHGKSPLENTFSRDRFHLLAITNPYHSLLDLLNVKYLLTYQPLNEGDRWKLVFDQGIKAYQNKKVMPRAFIAYNYKIAKNNETALQFLDNPAFNPRETVILEEKIKNDLGPASPNKVEIIKYSPLEIKITAYTTSPGILVLGDSYYPGWRAKVDDRPVKILRAYSIFRAVPLSQGNHRIIFKYLPLSFIGGVLITIITIIVIILEVLRRLIKNG